MLVIGSGPAGQKAAIQSAKAGYATALIEREAQIGGACVHSGTIPSKALREHALRQRVRQVDLSEQPLSSLLAQVAGIISAHDRYMAAQLKRNGITLLRGRAHFDTSQRISIRRVDGSVSTVKADRIIIATGSKPRAPESLHIDHEHILDSDSILSLSYLPRSLLVIGGGVIASEYATIFAALGTQVIQVDRAGRPLTFLDTELTDYYRAELERMAGEFRGEVTVSACRWDGVSEVISHCSDGRELRTDKVLVAQGRIANIQGLNLESIGVSLTSRGDIAVNEQLCTSIANIYAAGDVIGPPSLASAAMEQGRRAACFALGLPTNPVALSTLPSGVYTIPEIATVGLDATKAQQQHGQILIGRARYQEIARGQINGSVEGLLKLVATACGSRLLGVQIVGDAATELIHIGQMALAAQLPVQTFIDNVFNFPTMAEAYRVAALDIIRQQSGGHSAEQSKTTRSLAVLAR
jgi:NAD(P) transhydrogenase